MVHSKASSDPEERASFVEKCGQLFSDAGFTSRSGPAQNSVPLPADPFGNVPWDDNVSDDELELDAERETRGPVSILDDERFRLFDPNRRSDLLLENVYKSTFGSLLERMNDAFLAEEENRT